MDRRRSGKVIFRRTDDINSRFIPAETPALSTAAVHITTIGRRSDPVLRGQTSEVMRRRGAEVLDEAHRRYGIIRSAGAGVMAEHAAATEAVAWAQEAAGDDRIKVLSAKC
jgi:hypothetical protein